MATSSTTISGVIMQDHSEILTFYDEYKRSVGDKDAQERWSRQLIWEIARHSIGEEIVVYPLFEKHLGQKGIEMANHDRTDHQTVKDRLYRLESLSPGSLDHASLLGDIIESLLKHITAEESEDLPLLESKLSKEASAEVAAEFSRTKMFVPTRPHPSAPDKPPYETLAGLMATPIDKLKDMFAKFPTSEMQERASQR